MRICLIATEIFSHGVYGGFGALTKKIASGLAQKGIEVYVAMPRKKGQKPIELIDNFFVVSYPSYLYTATKESRQYASIYKMIDADIYHSEEPSLGTYLAQLAAPEKKHIVTFQDPRALEDWKKQWDTHKKSKLSQLKFILKYFYLEVSRAVRKADATFSQAKYVIEKAQRIYNLKTKPVFLPNPVDIPNRVMKKSDTPTVCFLGRWDAIKRPELFFELAKKHQKIKFIATGLCQPDYKERENLLINKYSNIPNLEMTGWVFGEEKSQILEKSWILINTSIKECLPVSYLEACAHKCAILSHGNADSFPEKFGYFAKEGELDDFDKGLEYLVKDNRWEELGEKGFQYVKDTFENNKVIDEHIKIYNNLLRK
jgi:glycosyltransferase involved in cell wall biosynthesis